MPSSPRYTPRLPAFRIRPDWHKVIGCLLVALGAALAITNDIQWVSEDVTLLPGGHTEAYLLLALGIAAYGAWWLGVFDRPERP